MNTNKAPDKIYLQELNDGTWDDCFVYVSSETDTKGMKRVPYIRKDALLEWAKFVLKCQEEELAKYDGPSYMKASIMGRIDAYKVLINKLNEM